MPPDSPHAKTEQQMLDDIGKLTISNDLLRIKLGELRAERDWHERLIQEKYQDLWRMFSDMMALLKEISTHIRKKRRARKGDKPWHQHTKVERKSGSKARSTRRTKATAPP